MLHMSVHTSTTMSAWISAPLAIILFTGGLGCWACDFYAVNTCITSAQGVWSEAVSTWDSTIICKAMTVFQTSVDACLQGCDQSILDQVKDTLEYVKQSQSPYDQECQPGCENYSDRQSAIGACSFLPDETQDYRKMCSKIQNHVTCVYDQVGNCSSLATLTGLDREYIINAISGYGCSLQFHEETLGLEDLTQCGNLEPLLATAQCYRDSFSEYGLDVMPGPAGGLNYGAFDTFNQAMNQAASSLVSHPGQQPQICQKLSYQSLRKGEKCMAAWMKDNTDCAETYPAITEKFGSVCQPACVNYSAQIAKVNICLGTSDIAKIPIEVLEKSIEEHGAASEYCGPAKQTAECLNPALNGCGLTILYFRLLLADESNGIALLSRGCNIEFELSVKDIEEEQTTPKQYTPEPTGSAPGASVHLSSLLGVCVTMAFFKVF